MNAADLQSQFNAAIQRAVDEIMARLAQSGWTPSGWLTTRLAGPLWLASTFQLFTDADTLAVGQASTYGAVSMSHTVRVIFATVGTPPTGGPLVVQVQKWSLGVATVIATLTIPDGGTGIGVQDTVGTTLAAGDQLSLNVVSVGLTTPGAGLEVVVVTRVDVVRGDAWGAG